MSDMKTYRLIMNVIRICEKFDMCISSLSEALCAYDLQCDMYVTLTPGSGQNIDYGNEQRSWIPLVHKFPISESKRKRSHG